MSSRSSPEDCHEGLPLRRAVADTAKKLRPACGRGWGGRFDASFVAIVIPSPRHIPGTGGQIAEPNQVDLVTTTVFRCLEQVLHAGETRFARQIMGDIRKTDRHNRIHHNLPLVHAIATASLD